MTVCNKAQLRGKHCIGTALTGGPWGKGVQALLIWWLRMVVMPEETYIGALGNNGVQDIRAHTLACLV